MKDIYVVVAENDQNPRVDQGGPIVFEQYVSCADLKSVKDKAARMSENFGKCRVAKLQFIDENQMDFDAAYAEAYGDVA